MSIEKNTSVEDENIEEYEDSDYETVTQKVLGWLWFFFKIGFVCSIVIFIVGICALVAVVKNVSASLPIISDESYRPHLTSFVYDCKGRVICKLHAEENRTRILASHEIPNIMKGAVVAIEDERFFQHYGIDLYGITRAMLTNLRAGRIVQGASTLTQQLIKNAFLTPEKTLKRKVLEALMAFQLERKYSKDEIITLYLNEIYFDRGLYGLAAAAEQYFGKDPKDLTIAECAMLASIPKSPSAYSPIRNPEKNAERRKLVLTKMVELGFITPAQFEEAKNEKIKLLPLSSQESKAPYFTSYVRDQLLEKYGANLVYNEGLKIYTTLDLDMQKYAEEAMAAAPIFAELASDTQINGSLVCLDPKNGHIKAMYGGRDYNKSQFNRVTQALRQPGSSFKSIVYTTALEEGMLPNDMIRDEPIEYTNPWTKDVWRPKNFDHKFRGDVTVMKSVCKSYNIPAVKVIDKIGVQKVVRMAKRMRITSPIDANLSLALGTCQVTPLEMASAYSIFANGGIQCPPLSILKVVDRDNNVLEENVPKAQEVIKAIHAAMMCDMLRSVVERGSGAKAKIKGRTIGGKTGTTNNYVDAWFNGITPELVTVVQFGFDMPKSMGKNKSGGALCCPVWKSFMEKALANYPASDFPVPEGAVRCKVCMTSGKLASSQCPASEVIVQVFPIESQPLTECNHTSFVALQARVNENNDDSELPPEVMSNVVNRNNNNFFSDSYNDNYSNTFSSDYGTNYNSWVPQQNKNVEQRNFIPLNKPNINANNHEPGVYISPYTNIEQQNQKSNSNQQTNFTPSIKFQDDYF